MRKLCWSLTSMKRSCAARRRQHVWMESQQPPTSSAHNTSTRKTPRMSTQSSLCYEKTTRQSFPQRKTCWLQMHEQFAGRLFENDGLAVCSLFAILPSEEHRQGALTLGMQARPGVQVCAPSGSRVACGWQTGCSRACTCLEPSIGMCRSLPAR